MLRTSCRLAESLLHRRASFAPADTATAPGTTDALGVLVDRLHARLDELSGQTTAPYVLRARARLEGLAPGEAKPRYVARDTAGNEIRSNDFDGKITLYRAWDASSPVSLVAHKRDAALLRKHWDRPFELVGMTDHADRAAHLEALPARGFAGTQLFDGPIGPELVDALAKSGGAAMTTATSALESWFLPAPGSSILVDSRGVIRGRDLTHDELDALILELVNEHRLLLRERRQGR